MLVILYLLDSLMIFLSISFPITSLLRTAFLVYVKIALSIGNILFLSGNYCENYLAAFQALSYSFFFAILINLRDRKGRMIDLFIWWLLQWENKNKADFRSDLFNTYNFLHRDELIFIEHHRFIENPDILFSTNHKRPYTDRKWPKPIKSSVAQPLSFLIGF